MAHGLTRTSLPDGVGADQQRVSSAGYVPAAAEARAYAEVGSWRVQPQAVQQVAGPSGQAAVVALKQVAAVALRPAAARAASAPSAAPPVPPAPVATSAAQAKAPQNAPVFLARPLRKAGACGRSGAQHGQVASGRVCSTARVCGRMCGWWGWALGVPAKVPAPPLSSCPPTNTPVPPTSPTSAAPQQAARPRRRWRCRPSLPLCPRRAPPARPPPLTAPALPRTAPRPTARATRSAPPRTASPRPGTTTTPRRLLRRPRQRSAPRPSPRRCCRPRRAPPLAPAASATRRAATTGAPRTRPRQAPRPVPRPSAPGTRRLTRQAAGRPSSSRVRLGHGPGGEHPRATFLHGQTGGRARRVAGPAGWPAS
jgi:hypothetical protein